MDDDFSRAVTYARVARLALDRLRNVLEPHKDEVLCYCDGIYPESIDFAFDLSGMADEIENLDDYIPFLEALAKGE